MTIILLFTTSSYLVATDITQDEYRLMDSMSFEELLDIEIVTGVPMEQKLAPAVTTILTSQEMRKNGARTLHEALEQVPGLHIFPSDLDLAASKVSIRGIQTGFSPQVLFLMDGSPLNDLLNGHPGFVFKMPISIINRIEIIRGAGSALHGADAFSGVINIISKKHDNIIDQVGTRYGSFNTWESWVNKTVMMDDLSIGLNLSIMQSDGDNARELTDKGGYTGSLDTRYDTGYFHADLSYKEIDVNLLIERSRDLGVGIGRKHYLDPEGYVDRDKILTDIKHTNKNWFDTTIIKTKIYFSYLDSQVNNNPFHDYRQGKPYAKEYLHGISSNLIYTGFDNHTINFKIGYEYGEIDPSQRRNFDNGGFDGELIDITDDPNLTYMLEQTRMNYYGLVQDEYKIDEDLILTTGVRYDYYDDFGSTINPRLALVWKANNDITLKTMYGRAFRAPTFGELYTLNSPGLGGNPDLNPETIDTYEIALHYEAKIHTKVNLFYYQAKDLIDYVEDITTGIYVAQNIKDQTGYGAELEIEYFITNEIGFIGNYSYQHSQNTDTKERVANVPAHQAFAQVQYKPTIDWNINTQYFYIGKRYRESTDIRDDLDADSIVNLTIERTNILKGLDALLSARNLFDADYVEPSISIEDDYPMPGRYLFAELRYRF